MLIVIPVKHMRAPFVRLSPSQKLGELHHPCQGRKKMFLGRKKLDESLPLSKMPLIPGSGQGGNLECAG
jgi:hypothetical protein